MTTESIVAVVVVAAATVDIIVAAGAGIGVDVTVTVAVTVIVAVTIAVVRPVRSIFFIIGKRAVPTESPTPAWSTELWSVLGCPRRFPFG